MSDRSEAGNYSEHLARIGAALDRFLQFGNGDPVDRRAEWTAALDRPLPAMGIPAAEVIDELTQTVLPNGARLAEPGFLGWITTAPDTLGVVTTAAAALASPQRYTITAFNLLEEVSLKWLAELSGLGAHMGGVYSSGGSVANLVALGAARQWALEQVGIDPAADGIGGRALAMYASAEAHHTVQRAAAVLGIGRSRVRLIETDAWQRMRPDLLQAAIDQDLADGVVPVAVVATAGTTNTGAVDPLHALGEIAHAHKIWFHVDGAYGLLGPLDPRVAPLYDGIELADSAIVDPHKWLRAPVGIAATYVRDRAILYRAFTQETAAYMESMMDTPEDEIAMSLDSLGIPYSEFAVELSSPARGAVVWSILRELGRAGVATRIRRDNDLARRVADLVRNDPHLELVTEPVLSICCFRYAADGIVDLDEFNTELLRRLHRETPYMPSSTRVGGAVALRPCFINARAREDTADGLIAAVRSLGDAMLAAN
jgi:aromatic-L-amino-acid/L-tryptophan decarboxylase